MINTVAIAGYRSLRDIVIPLGQLTVITGANGTGKSSIYRSLRLLSDIADDRTVATLAREGGLPSVLWAGPENISAQMRRGEVPIQGTARKNPIALKLGFQTDDYSCSIELGLPSRVPGSLFDRDPAIKREAIWTSDKPSPAHLILDRRGPSVRACGPDGEMTQVFNSLPPYSCAVRHTTGPAAPPMLSELRANLSNWRFYDQMRTDTGAAARKPQVGTRTLALSPSGEDLAAAIQTILEIGDADALQSMIELAFDGAKIGISVDAGLFQLWMEQPGMLRPLGMSELSDGTLRFLLLAAALLSPRPAPLIVLNEPEASLHSDVIPALASLITRCSEDSQTVIVSHNRTLVTSLMQADAEIVELHKDHGETFATVSDSPSWTWPKR